MYISLLIRKYLLKRRIAWASLIAVMLCTAMVLVVVSVMGGWLDMFKSSFKGLSGDVIVQGKSYSGFPHYEKMIAEIQKLPNVTAAVPTIETFGFLSLQKGAISEGVSVLGYPMDRIGLVNRFPRSLYLRHQLLHDLADGDVTQLGDLEALYLESRSDGDVTAVQRDALRLAANKPKELSKEQRTALRDLADASGPSTDLPLPPGIYRDRLPNLRRRDAADFPGMIIAARIAPNEEEDGGAVRGYGTYVLDARLTVPESKPGAGINIDALDAPVTENFWVADDSLTGVHIRDSTTVYIDFAKLQEMAGMKGRSVVDTETGAESVEPSRTSAIQVAAMPGTDLDALKAQVQNVVDRITLEEGMDYLSGTYVQTWEDVNRPFISQVEKETALVTFLLSLVSVVAIFLIFCIFYMIVVEKTRDIGILKSVGATGTGIATIFLGYGAVIGIVGGLAGLLLGGLVVWNINAIHQAMITFLHVRVWDPQFYQFDKIPNTLPPVKASIIFGVAVVSSIIGAVVPALQAARLKPVEALRFE